jgi:hypothetical protein
MPRQGTQERAPGARQSAFRPRPLFQATRAARASWRPYGALQKGCLRARGHEVWWGYPPAFSCGVSARVRARDFPAPGRFLSLNFRR